MITRPETVCDMDKMEQRAVIKFHAKLGTSATRTFEMMQKVYGDNCLSRGRIFDWHRQFREGREDLQDEYRQPKAKKSRTPEIIESAREIIASDPNATTRVIGGILGISSSTVQAILTKDLRLKKVCTRFVYQII